MSQTIVSVFVMLLVQILPLIGVHPDSEVLTTTIQTIVSVVAGLWIWIRRVKVGDVNAVGVRKA